MAIVKVYHKTRQDGVNLYRTYSNVTPIILQQPTDILYKCWVYKLDENGIETNEVDWDLSGVVDVEHSQYTYEEVIEDSSL